MRYALASAALAASATLVLAAPTSKQQIPSTFTVNQVYAGQRLKVGAIDLLAAHNKYARIGAVAPAHVVSAAKAANQDDGSGQTGTVAADPTQYDSSYLEQVTIGSQTLNLDFDTGSSDLWVFSTLLPSDEQSGHNLYDPSNAQVEQGESWQISYGDGSGASGVVYADQVVVGGATATQQAVEAATSVSSEFVKDTNTDGLLGLAFSSINTVTPDQQNTWFDTVKSSLQSQLFTADLKAGQAGSYDFGFIDSSKYTGDITYVSVDNSQGFWGFTADGYAVNDGTPSGSIGAAIADTGTSLLLVPDSVVSDYYSNVSGAQNSNSDGGYIFDCSATLPDFVVSIGGSTFTVPGSYINYAPASESGSCFGGIQSSSSVGTTIFGDIFLKNQFVVFDESTGSPRLGFAAQ